MRRFDRGSDFASGVMMRLIAFGLERQGLTSPAPPPAGAHVPVEAKRSLIQTLLRQHGPLTILHLVDAAADMPREPVVQALLNAGGAEDLYGRWQRLEKFSHSRHEVVVEQLGGTDFRLQHISRDQNAPPLSAETMIVIALLAMLTEIVSGAPVFLAPENSSPWRKSGNWLEPAAVSPGTAFLLRTGPVTAPAPQCGEGERDDLVSGIRSLVLSDPVRKWNVADLAVLSGVTSRTLQRRLKTHDTSVSRLVSQARLQHAASMLCDGPAVGLAEIGFLSGYSDQAHFTRSFVRSVGTTPKAYRSDFARPQTGRY